MSSENQTVHLSLTFSTKLSANNYFPEQSYNPEAYEELMDFVGRHPLDDGDKFCATMFRESSRHKNLGKDYQAYLSNI